MDSLTSDPVYRHLIDFFGPSSKYDMDLRRPLKLVELPVERPQSKGHSTCRLSLKQALGGVITATHCVLRETNSRGITYIINTELDPGQSVSSITVDGDQHNPGMAVVEALGRAVNMAQVACRIP